MLVLGIETATRLCGVALAEEGRLLCEYRAQLKNRHAALLGGAIDSLLRDAALPVQQLHGIAVSIGPGSFTGLRIGLAMAKGIAFATGCRLTAVPTLEALAEQAPGDETSICALLPARGQEVYAALYHRKDGRLHCDQEPQVVGLDRLLSGLPSGTFCIGQAADGPSLPPESGRLRWASAESSLPSGLTIARLGGERFRQDLCETPDLLEPRYLQDFIVGRPRAAVFAPDPHEG